MAREAINAKNKNVKLNREVLVKEQHVMDTQNKLALAESDLKHL